MSTETPNLKLFKYDKEIDKNQYVDIDKLTNENWDKIDEFAGRENADIQAMQETIEQLQSENTTLKSQIPTRQVEGENIHLKDSSNLPFKKFRIGGNDYQKTSEASSNILDPNRLTKGFINVDTGELEERNPSYPDSSYTPLINLKINDTIRVFNAPNGGSRIRIYNTDGTYKGDYSTNFQQYTATEDCQIRILFLYTILDNTMIKINDTNSEYEEFIPNMPSIDYKSDVKACGDNINIFNTEYFIDATKYQSPENKSQFFRYIEITDIRVKDEITIHAELIGNNLSNYNIKIGTSTDTDQVSDSILATNSTLKTITKDFSKAEHIYLLIGKNTGINNSILQEILYEIFNNYKFKLEKGKIATPWSPYGMGSISIEKSNGNLAKIIENNFELTENNTIKNIKRANNARVIESIKVRKGQVVKVRFKLFSKPTTSTTFTAAKNGATLSSLTIVNFNNFNLNQNYDKSWTATEDCEIFYAAWGDANNETFEFQLSISLDDPIDYIPHKSNQYIIQTQQTFFEGDYFDLDNNEEVHLWNKIDSYNNEDITTDFISTTGELSIGATVIYKLETPVRVPMNQEQIDILNKIKADGTYKNITYLYSNDEIQPNIKVGYYKDSETIEKQQDDKIAELERRIIALEGGQ